MEPLHILIADDHPVFRTGLRALIQATPAMEIVGEAATGEEALTLAAQTQPDVVLMDLQMPGMGGVEAIRRIHDTSPHIRVLVLTMFQDDESLFAALRVGAHGYLVKGANHQEVVRAIAAIGAGEAIFSPVIAQRLLDYFAAARPAPVPLPELTEREREILRLIVQRQANTAIAATLVISPKTLRNHISNIFSKLQVADRAQAILRARDAGLG